MRFDVVVLEQEAFAVWLTHQHAPHSRRHSRSPRPLQLLVPTRDRTASPADIPAEATRVWCCKCPIRNVTRSGGT